VVGGEEGDLAAIEAGGVGQFEERGLAAGVHGAVGGNHLDEDDEDIIVAEVGEDQVWEVLVGLDLEADRVGELVVAVHDPVPALAEPEDGGLIEEAGREHLDDRLGDDGTGAGRQFAAWACRNMP